LPAAITAASRSRRSRPAARPAGDTYLVAANEYDGSSYDIDSKLYVWIPKLQCFGMGFPAQADNPERGAM
jgi:hypothetical protein